MLVDVCGLPSVSGGKVEATEAGAKVPRAGEGAGQRSRRRRGFATGDVLLALGVLAVIGLFGLWNYIASRGTNNVSRTAEAVSTIATNVRQLYASSPNFGTANMFAVLNSSQSIPAGFNVDPVGGVILHPWGGTVTVVGATATFNVTLNAPLAQEACIKIAAYSISQQSLTINGTAYVPPVDPVTAQGACVAGTANTLGYNFTQ